MALVELEPSALSFLFFFFHLNFPPTFLHLELLPEPLFFSQVPEVQSLSASLKILPFCFFQMAQPKLTCAAFFQEALPL